MEEVCEANYTLEDKTKTLSLLFQKIRSAVATFFSSILLPPFMSTHSPISPISSFLSPIVQALTPTIPFLYAVVDRCLSALDRSVRRLVLVFFSAFLCISLPMFFLEDIWRLVFPEGFRDRTQAFSVLLLRTITNSMNAATCVDAESELCRDDSAAFILKFIAMASILVAGVAGIAIPLVGGHRSFLKTDSNLFVAAKAFAAGVILSTGFVHMLSAGSAALSSSCLPTFPWSKFPFPGFFAMLAALVTLLVDFVGTQYCERMQGLSQSYEEKGQVGTLDAGFISKIVLVEEAKKWSGDELGEGEGDGMKIAGMHSRGIRNAEEEIDVRHVVASQILELGIVSHSAIIGLSLGVSHSPCTIRPLIAALSFHQFFEGFALGRCISKAQFDPKTATIMACFFAATTPIGIAAGITVASFYNPLSSGALVAEGIFDSLSAGVLVYMALVNLIAADFLSKSKRMRCNFRLQVVSYFMLFLGAGLMSLLALWV